MKLPITQEHIDEAIKRLEQRRLGAVIDRPESVTAKTKKKGVQKKKYRKYAPKRDNFDKMMDYAIAKDKD